MVSGTAARGARERTARGEHEYVVLASPWDHHWDVFVLDPAIGLLGATVAGSPDQVEAAAVALLRGLPDHGRDRFHLTVLS